MNSKLHLKKKINEKDGKATNLETGIKENNISDFKK